MLETNIILYANYKSKRKVGVTVKMMYTIVIAQHLMKMGNCSLMLFSYKFTLYKK